PEFMDYPRAQMLLIGDTTAFGKKVEGDSEEAGTEAETDSEEDAAQESDGDGDGDNVPGVLNQLESEHVERMKHLSAQDAEAIYADLQSRALAHSDSGRG
ncbi:hypothetical protein E4U43_000969, partial [Claviceps pusilla]